MGHLFVIPARDEPVAVILRRGPSRWYHVILWDTRRDWFTHGAWFKGRIYEDKCDLSPDGRLFLYNVHSGSRVEPGFTHTWTAISRPPWLHALVLWPHLSTYDGGGRFTGLRTVWGISAAGTHPDFPLPANRLQFADAPPPPRETNAIVPGSDWSGQDHAGHVIYCRAYALYRRIKRKDLVVADFSDLTPDPQPAPDWASRPL